MSTREPWLGHRDHCSLQWSDRCDCLDPADDGPAPIPASADELQANLLLAYAQGRWSDDTVCLLVAAVAAAATLGADPIAKARALDLLRRAHEAVSPK